MSYSSYDFTESLERAGLPIESVRNVVAAWGSGGESYAEWEGGFLLELRDGRFAYVTGWCDTSGWGCQDDAEVYFYSSSALDRAQLPGPWGSDSKLGVADWDESPADLNRTVAEKTIAGG